MATFTSTAGARLVKKDSTTSNDTYVVLDDSKGLVLTGNANGDTIKIDGLSTDFTFKASGKTLTLTSVDDSSFRIQVQIANGGSVTLGFLDGGVTASYASTGSTKGVTLAGSAGTQKVTSKAAALADAVSVNEATASVDTFDTTTTTTTTTTTGVSTNLTATVGETATGTGSDDTFNAATNVTFQDGDQINGFSGNDVLNLIANGSGVTTFLNSVETLNVRMLSSTTLDASLWSGTGAINVTNDSLDDKTLTLTGLASGVVLGLNDKVNVNATLLDATGASDTVKVLVNSAGTGSVTVASVETINLFASGTNVLDLEGGASLANVAVSGNGTLTLTTNDTVSAINLSQFSGTTTTTVSAASNLSFTGNTGNDTVVFSLQNLTSADTLSGGAGTDTLRASLDGAELKNVSNFETGNFAVSAAVDSNFSGFSTLSFSGGTDVSLNLSGIAVGATVNFGNISASTVSLGYDSGGVANVNLTGSAGTVALSTTRVTGASTVNVLVAGSASAYTISSLRLESGDSGGGADTVKVGVDSSGSLTIVDLRARDAETVTLQATGDAAVFSVSTDLQAAGATSLSLIADGSAASVDVSDTLTVTGIASTLNLTASGTRAAIDVDGFSADQNANLTINMNLGKDAKFGSAADFDVAIATSGTLSFSGTLGASAGATLSTLDAGNSGVATIGLTLGAAATGTIGAINAQRVASVTLNVASEASATLSTITGAGASGTVGAISLNQAASGNISLGNVVASAGVGAVTFSGGADARVSAGGINAVSAVGAITINGGISSVSTLGDVTAASATIGAIGGTLGASAAVTIGDLTASGSIGAITFNLGAGADLTLGSATITGNSSQDSFGAISISGVAEVDVAIAAISARQSIGNIAIAIGGSASFSAGAINSVSSTIGTISFAVGEGSVASADFTASLGSIGNVSLTGSGTLDINSLKASASIGSITVGDGAIINLGAVSASTVGDISLGGRSGTLAIGASAVGRISVTGSGATITNGSGTIDSVSIASVGGTADINFGAAKSIGGITVTGNSSIAKLDLSGVSSLTEITLGTGTNVVTVSTFGDQLTLKSNTGVDTIRFGGSAFDGAGVKNFQFGSTVSDVLGFGSAGFQLGLTNVSQASASDNAVGALNVAHVYTAGVGVTFGSAAGATDVLVVSQTGFAGHSGLFAALASAGSLRISAVGDATVTAGGEILVVWYNTDESRTELSLVHATANVSSSEFFQFATGGVSLLATFSGNIRTFSGSTTENFGGDFTMYSN